MAFDRNPVGALEFPDAPQELLTNDQFNSIYAGILQPYLHQGNGVILDPDFAIEADPEAYRKMVAELAIASKLRKRTLKVISAPWRVYSKDKALIGLCGLLEHIFHKIKRFRVALHSLTFNSNLKGMATSRIFGEFQDVKLKGDWQPRRWWLPTNMIDVGKQRWRIHKEDPERVRQGADPYFWAVQDIVNYNWYRIDDPNGPPGLRRQDYVWAKSSEDEDDLGYAHGLGRGIYHRWFMASHSWIYAMDGAESWSKGKIVISTPNSLGGGTIPGSLSMAGQRKQQAIRDATAQAAAKQLSKDVLVLDSGQEFQLFGRPESGHESVKWIIEKTDEDYDEYILGIKKGENKPWSVDPDIVGSDKNNLEDCINDDLFESIITNNEYNFYELGYTLDDVRECRWEMKRDSGLDPEQRGKSIQIVLAAGAPVHQDDLYGGLGLTPVDHDSPDAVWAPQAGQGAAQDMGVQVREPGQGVDDWQANPDGSPVEPVSAPTPGGAPLPQANPYGGTNLPI